VTYLTARDYFRPGDDDAARGPVRDRRRSTVKGGDLVTDAVTKSPTFG